MHILELILLFLSYLILFGHACGWGGAKWVFHGVLAPQVGIETQQPITI